MQNVRLTIPEGFDVTKYTMGVLVARMQIDELHLGHKALLGIVNANHSKVVIFLGVGRAAFNKRDPLNYDTRALMIKEEFPDFIIMPLLDNRSDEAWSNKLDSILSREFPDEKPLFYGSRDSFIPYYSKFGNNTTVELESDINISATEIRDVIGKGLPIPSADFRRGVIFSAYNKYPVTYPTVDICAVNQLKQLLLAKKPNEDKWRFIGGFVDPSDASYEDAAKREFSEETGGGKILDLEYVTSARIDDWRYSKIEDGIMTTFYIGSLDSYIDELKPTDDIEKLKWFDYEYFDSDEKIKNMIMPEHVYLFNKLLEFF